MKEKEMFNEFYARTKEEIIEEFKSYMDYCKNENEYVNDKQKEKYIKLCNEFLKKLENTRLPILTDDWWCYNFSPEHDSINLDLEYCENLEIENGEISGATFSVQHVLLSVKCEYLTVAEYAEMNSVTEVTVRQWIRRGKLRGAKKKGRDWIIPSIYERPTRGFVDVIYFTRSFSNNIVDKYPFLEGFTEVAIFQNKEDKRIFDIILRNNIKDKKIRIEMNNKEREKFELELISSGLFEFTEF